MQRTTGRFPVWSGRAVLPLVALFVVLLLALTACTLPGKLIDPTPTPTLLPPTATAVPTAASTATTVAAVVATPTRATPVVTATTGPTTVATPTSSPTRPAASPTAARGTATAVRGTPTPGTARTTPGATPTREPFTATAEEPCKESDLEQTPLPEKPATVATVEHAYRCLLLHYVDHKTTLDHKVLLNGAWNIFRDAGLPAADVAPLALTGDKEADWKVYEGRFNGLVAKYGRAINTSLLAHVAIDGMARSLDDNHVAYLEPKLWRRFQAESAGDERTIGPGFDLGIDDASGKFYVYEVYANTPAAQGGLKAGDIIDQVGGAAAAKGVGNQDLYELLTGDVGVRTTLRVTRPATGQALTIQVSVSEYIVPLIDARIVGDKVGYIKLRQFSNNAGEEFDKALAGLQAQGIRALIFDVRQNPGGSTDALRHIISHFTHTGPHAITIDEDGKREEENPDTEVPLLNLPWVVLSNNGSASSADITAAVAKDRGGYLIGAKTAGALGGALVYELEDGSALEITVVRVLGPDGEDINEIGVTPNQEVPLAPADLSAGKDTQLQAALTYLQGR